MTGQGTAKPRICHLVDDLNPGGVTRLLEFIQGSGPMQDMADHQIICTGLGAKFIPVTDADIIVSHLSVKWANLPFFARLRARYRTRSLIHVEHSYSQAFLEAHVPAKGRFRQLLRTSYALFDRIVAVSSPQGAWLRAFAVPRPGKLVVIPPCVDLAAFLAVPSAQGAPVRRIGAIGRLHDQKGFDILIDAFVQADLDGAYLDIFGDGPEEADLRSRAKGHARIVFHGFTDDPVGAMAGVDVIAMPSLREPYGLVALEALASGRRLMASRVDGLADHIANGAIKVDPNTPQAWAEALRAVIATPDDARIRRGREGARAAEARFAANWRDLIAGL